MEEPEVKRCHLLFPSASSVPASVSDHELRSDPSSEVAGLEGDRAEYDNASPISQMLTCTSGLSFEDGTAGYSDFCVESDFEETQSSKSNVPDSSREAGFKAMFKAERKVERRVYF